MEKATDRMAAKDRKKEEGMAKETPKHDGGQPSQEQNVIVKAHYKEEDSMHIQVLWHVIINTIPCVFPQY